MKVLIKTIEELQKFLKADSTFPVSSIDAYQHDAIDDQLREALGDELCDELIDWYAAGAATEEHDNLVALLEYAQRVVARFAFMKAAPNLDLKLMDSGFGVVSTSDMAPASKDRVNRFVEQLESAGWDAVEQLLRFLEKNKANYQNWTDSDAYTMAVRNFINSAEEFDKYVNIGKSRLKFKELRNEMDVVEMLQVIPVMGEQLADEIKDEMKDGSLSEANKKLLPIVKRAVAFITAGKLNLNANAARNGESFLSEIKRFLDSNVDDYPLYKDSLYLAERNYERFENSTDYGFFVGGQE